MRLNPNVATASAGIAERRELRGLVDAPLRSHHHPSARGGEPDPHERGDAGRESLRSIHALGLSELPIDRPVSCDGEEHDA